MMILVILSFRDDFVIAVKCMEGNEYIYLSFKNLRELGLVLCPYHHCGTSGALSVYPCANPVILLFGIYTEPFIAFSK